MKRINLILFSAITMLFGVNAAASAEDVDMSDYFGNLDFETTTSETDGEYTWNVLTVWELGYAAFQTYEPRTYDNSWMPSNMSGTILYGWNGSNSTTSISKICTQTSNAKLPGGTYSVSAYVYAEMTGISLYAIAHYEDGETGTEVTQAVSASTSLTSYNQTAITITLDSAAYLEIGLKAEASLTYSSNFFVDNFSVTQTSESSNENEDATTEDVDDLFTNLGFNTGDFTGWTVAESPVASGTEGTDYGIDIATVDEDSKSSLLSGYCCNIWVNSDITLNSGSIISQSAEVESGIYYVSAMIHSNTSGLSLYINNESTTIDPSNTSNWEDAVVVSAGPVTVTAADGSTSGTLEIGIKATSSISNNYNWDVYVDNFEVKKAIESVDEDPTGITSIQPTLTTSNTIYNIQGMRVSDTSKKGLYIINGKKVVVK